MPTAIFDGVVLSWLWVVARHSSVAAGEFECGVGAESADRFVAAFSGVWNGLLRVLPDSRAAFAKGLLAGGFDPRALCRDYSVWHREEYSGPSL